MPYFNELTDEQLHLAHDNALERGDVQTAQHISDLLFERLKDGITTLIDAMPPAPPMEEQGGA